MVLPVTVALALAVPVRLGLPARAATLSQTVLMGTPTPNSDDVTMPTLTVYSILRLLWQWQFDFFDGGGHAA